MNSNTHKGKYRVKNKKKYVDRSTIDDVIYRSSWEKMVMIWCDNNPDIIKWGSETVVIPYVSKIDNKQHRYFVDFYIQFKDGRKFLVEVKPRIQTKEPVKTKKKTEKRYIQEVTTYAKNISKWEAAKRFAENHGAKFLVWTEDELSALGLKINVSKKFRYVKYAGKQKRKINYAAR